MLFSLALLAVACSANSSVTSTDAAPGISVDVLPSATDALKVADLASDPAVDAPPTHCNPGKSLLPFDMSTECSGGFCICRTYQPDGGTLTQLTGWDVYTSVISRKLPEPMKAGQPYTFSIALSNRNYTGDLELWGSDSECGPGLERLYSAPFDSRTYCTEVHPSGDYPYVLFVRQFTGKGGASSAAQNYAQFYACPTGSCP
jgi:hypothetical protein